MKYQKMNSITDVTRGIIVHQVNCQGVMGAGVARAIITKWPKVKKEYITFCHNTKDLLGKQQEIKINDDLSVINLFTQEYYGNAYKNKRKYTDENLLISNIVSICHAHKDTPVYIPERIGCELAGGDWVKVSQALINANLDNLIVVTIK